MKRHFQLLSILLLTTMLLEACERQTPTGLSSSGMPPGAIISKTAETIPGSLFVQYQFIRNYPLVDFMRTLPSNSLDNVTVDAPTTRSEADLDHLDMRGYTIILVDVSSTGVLPRQFKTNFITLNTKISKVWKIARSNIPSTHRGFFVLPGSVFAAQTVSLP